MEKHSPTENSTLSYIYEKRWEVIENFISFVEKEAFAQQKEMMGTLTLLCIFNLALTVFLVILAALIK